MYSPLPRSAPVLFPPNLSHFGKRSCIMRCADTAGPQLNAESLQENPPISFHSSKVVQSEILLVSLCSFSFLFSFSR